MSRRKVLFLVILALGGLFFLNRYAERSEVARRLAETSGPVTVTELEEKAADTGELNISRSNAITRAVQEVEQAVVSVNVIRTETVRRYLDPFENPFFGFFDVFPYQREVKAIGSGIIFDRRGYIITNAHVVEGATKIKILLSDGRQFDGELIGASSVQDIAVLKIPDRDLPSARFGTSSNLIIGEWAIAVGNPYGFIIKDSRPSVSVGVISAINRNFAESREGKVYRRMIQTDAAINPGNSGGPLVNIYGQVIGVNTFIFSESGGSIGIGFAIPIDRVKKIAAELIQYGRVREIWFGFRVQDITPMLADYLDLQSTDGVLVAQVDRSGPADRAGIRKLDIITEMNGTPVQDTDDAELAVADVQVGDILTMQVMREGKERTIRLEAVESRQF